MSDPRDELLLAALKRAGKPLDSSDLLDEATGLALADWEPGQVRLSRKSVAKRLQNMLTAGLVTHAGVGVDDGARRTTPLFAPVGGYDLRAPVPPPPAERPPAKQPGPFVGLTTAQTVTLMDVQDELLSLFGRHLQAQQQFFAELAAVREKVRGRLLSAGLDGR
jgi:DNA-binding Lrp family transcriptional regulator